MRAKKKKRALNVALLFLHQMKEKAMEFYTFPFLAGSA